MGKSFENLVKKPTEPKKVQIYWQADLMAITKSNVACVHRQNVNQYDSGERCDPWTSCFPSLHKHLYRIWLIVSYPTFCVRFILIFFLNSECEIGVFVYGCMNSGIVY
jgi:hypothetical protein